MYKQIVNEYDNISKSISPELKGFFHDVFGNHITGLGLCGGCNNATNCTNLYNVINETKHNMHFVLHNSDKLNKLILQTGKNPDNNGTQENISLLLKFLEKPSLQKIKYAEACYS